MASQLITDLDITKQHLKSYEQKSRNDFKWVERMGDYYDFGFGYNQEYINNVEINANLFKGVGITNKSLMKWLNRNQVEGDIRAAYTKVSHQDIIGHIAKAMVGYQRKRPFKPAVINTGPMEGNERQSESLKMIQEYISTEILPKYQEEASMNILAKNGIEDFKQLNPDEQQEVSFEIEQQMSTLTPDRIDDYMRKDFQSPTSKQLSELTEVMSREFDIKFMTDDHFKLALCSAVELYYSGVRGGQLVFEPVDVKGVIFEDFDSSPWIQDSMWLKNCTNLPVIEVLKRYNLDASDERQIKNATASMSNVEQLENSRLVGFLNDESELKDIDLRTNEGQWKYHAVKNKYGVNVSGNVLDVKHIVFQTVDKAKFVKRVIKGKIQGFYTGRDYELSELKGDIDVKDVKVPMVMQVTKIETGSKPIYTDKGPVPYSYRSLENPFKVTLPYVGAKYNKMMGNGDMVSHIDLGKQGQLKYNNTYAKMEEDESTDFGRVLSLVLSLKPSTYTIEEWLDMIRRDKFLLIGEENSATGQVDPNALNAIKQIDLGTIDKIASRLNQLQAIYKDTARRMGYNEAMLGQASPYESVANNQTNINLSANQTEDIYVLHDKIVEKSLTSLIQTALVYYKDKPLKKSWVMSDMSIGSMELNPDLIHASEVGVYLSMNIVDMQETEQMKQDAHAFIQAEQIDFEDYIKIRMAKSTTELINISRDSKRKKEQAAQSAQESYLKEKQDEREYETQVMDKEFENEKTARFENNEAKVQMASLSADQFSRAYDINKNKINDANERLDKELKYKKDKDREDRRIKMIEVAIEERKVELAGKRKP